MSALRIIFCTFLWIFLSAVVLLLLWSWAESPTYVERFRLSIEIEASGHLYSNSSVIEVWVTNIKFGTNETKGLRAGVSGQAVFVDLGQGRNLTALLGFGATGSRDVPGIVEAAFLPTHPGLTFETAPAVTGTAPLIGRLIPTLVTFTNLDDPTTGKVVAPDQLERVIAPDVHFRGATIEIVPRGWWPFRSVGWPPSLAGTPITRGIEKSLPMMTSHHNWMWTAYSYPDRFVAQFYLFSRP